MDPEANLVALRDLSRDVLNGSDEHDPAETARQLAEHVEALDDWLSRGGRPPADWAAR